MDTKLVWKALNLTQRFAPHCFVFGASISTIRYYVREHAHLFITESVIRKTLKEYSDWVAEYRVENQCTKRLLLSDPKQKLRALDALSNSRKLAKLYKKLTNEKK